MRSNLRDLMKKKKCTIRGISEQTGLALQTIVNARDNKKITSCTLATLQDLAHALDCKIKDLFTED